MLERCVKEYANIIIREYGDSETVDKIECVLRNRDRGLITVHEAIKTLNEIYLERRWK